MSYEPEYDSTAAVSRWLDRHQRALTEALALALDVEGGLREILLQSRHDAATEALDTVLDAEAGLAAILSVTDRPVSLGHPKTGAQLAPAAGETAAGVNAATRLALRSHRPVATASRTLARDRRYLSELNPARTTAENRHLALVLALGLARDVCRDLVQVLDGLTKLADPHNDVAQAHAQELLLSRYLARTVVLAQDLELDELSVRARSISRKPLPDRTLNQGASQAHSHGLVLILSHAKQLDHELDTALSFVRFQERADDSAFTGALVEIRNNRVRRALEQAIGQELPETGAEAVHEFLNDFTTADLRQADLADADLTGISWSEYGTQWPPGLNVEGLKQQSEETPPGSAVWTIRSDATTVGDFAEL